jgi:hypothetical protein
MMIKIDFLQLLESRICFGKFSQAYILKVGTESLEGRFEVAMSLFYFLPALWSWILIRINLEPKSFS